jgi:hypothetical protein
LNRFLNARKWDTDESIKYIKEWFEWRKETKPHKVQPHQVLNELKSEKGYWHGYDKENSPIIVCKVYNHDSGIRDFEESVNFTLFTAEV